MRPWCVFYATRVALVFADDVTAAYASFLDQAFPDKGKGHLARPSPEEVRIRELRAEDAGWIEEFPDHEAKPFLDALKGQQ